jgi:hypothetical protein
LFAFLILDVPSIGRKGTVAIFSLLGFLFMMFASFFTYADVDTVQAVVLLVKVTFYTCRTLFLCTPHFSASSNVSQFPCIQHHTPFSCASSATELPTWPIPGAGSRSRIGVESVGLNEV